MNETSKIIDEYLKKPDIHVERQAGLFGATVSLIVAFVASLIHGFNTYLAFWTDFSLLFVFIIHCVVCAVTIIFAKSLQVTGRDSRFMLLLGVTSCVTGVFGAVGTLLCILLHFWHMRGAMNFWEWFQSIFPDFDLTQPEAIYENIMFGRDENPMSYNVVPFLDVMSIGSEDQKREALSRMTERFQASFAPAFQKGLNDESNSIRVQAATSIAKIENQFLSRLMRINEAEKKFPNDPIIKLALAEHYDDYAFTGILDIERERLNQRRGIKHYKEYLDKQPNDWDVKLKYGRLLLRAKRYDEAADWFKKCVDEGSESNRLMAWHVESLYSAKRYDELRVYARSVSSRMSEFAEMRPNLVASVKFWAGEEYDPAIVDGEIA